MQMDENTTVVESDSEVTDNVDAASAANGASGTVDTASSANGATGTASWIKGLPKRWFIDAFTGMAQGLFVTLIAGTIIKTIGQLIGDNVIGNYLQLIGKIACILTGAGIGAGIATHLKSSKMVTFAAIVAGFIGAFSSQVINGNVSLGVITGNFAGGEIAAITAQLAKGLPGNPIGAYVCSLMAVEIGGLVSGKTKLEILIVPLVCTLVALIGAYVSFPFVWLVDVIGRGVAVATGAAPFFMGIIIAVVMGVLLTMPTSSAAIWVMLASGVLSNLDGSPDIIYNMYLAGGAAVCGCAAQMVGFAVSSYHDNGWAGIISQGIGTSMLQIPNIMKKPLIIVPEIAASVVVGPLSTCLFKLTCDASGGGMGTSGFVGIIGVINANKEIGKIGYGIPTWQMILGIVLLMVVLPAGISWGLTYLFRKKGWIADGDMKI